MKRSLFVLGTTVLTLAFVQPSPGAGMCGAMPDGVPAMDASTSVAGAVVETMNASRYTYVQIDTGKEKIWAAGPTVAVKTGDCISIATSMPNKSFYSPTLKRTFDEIYFVDKFTFLGCTSASGGCAKGGVTNCTGACVNNGCAKGSCTNGPCTACDKSMCAGKSGCSNGPCSACTKGGSVSNTPAAKPYARPPVVTCGNSTDEMIPKADGGMTVAEIWAGKDKLSGKTVIVRGRVVKVVPDIMGKTFLHLRDGTGLEGANDLTVTTTGPVTAKTIVTASGVLTTDKDFGAGYKYDVIMEDATVTAK